MPEGRREGSYLATRPAVACEQRVVGVLMAVEDLVNHVSEGCTRGGHDHTPVVLAEREIVDSCPRSVCADLNAIRTLPITSGVVIDGPHSAADQMCPHRLYGVP